MVAIGKKLTLITKRYSELGSKSRRSVIRQVLKCAKRYYIIDQQIPLHFVQYSECLSNPLLFYATRIINPFLNSRISANHAKGYRDFSQTKNLIPLNVSLL